MKLNKCAFDYDGLCGALVCYSDKKCNSRDASGNPQYAINDREIVNRLRSIVEEQR